MSHEEDPLEHEDHEPTPSGGAQSRDDGTFIQSLRAKREAIGKSKYVDLEVPGYDGALVVRYKRIPWDDFKRIARKVEKSKNPRKELIGHADTLIMACEEVLIRKDGVLEPIYNAFPEIGQDEPVQFDERLATCFGLDTSSAREVVFQVFKNDMAVTGQHNELVEWIQSSSSEEDEDFSRSS